jgi:hypothetical protein
MQTTNDVNKTKIRQPYEKPTVTKFTGEQAKLTLQEYANQGYEGAKELLELMSSGSDKTEKVSEEAPKSERRSA